jgi:DNA-binding MarR family transcriptional regulator
MGTMQHRQSRSDVLTLRRAVFAVLMSIVTLALTVGVVGFAAAGDGSSSRPPESFSVALAHVGDRGLYRVSEVERTSEGARTTLVPRDAFEFAWDPETTVRDAEGNPHLTQVLRFRTAPFEPTLSERRAYIDAKTGEIVASTWGLDYAQEATMFGVSMEFANQLELTTHHRLESSARSSPFCGVHNVLQGHETALRGTIQLFPACYFTYPVGEGVRSIHVAGRLEAVASEQLGGHDTVVFVDHGTGHDAYVWMARDVPYPIQFLVFDTPTSARLVQLVSFNAGDESLVDEGDPDPLATASPLEWLPREPFGMSERGVDHPFPLSEAYWRALSDPDGKDLRDFLSAHPDAAMVAADYDEQRDEDWHEIYWHMKFASGSAALSVGYMRQVGVRAPAIALLSDPVYAFHNRSIDPYRDVTYPPADKVPTALPTVASLMGRWSAYSGRPISDARSWGFFFECNDSSCDRPRMRVLAGSELLQGTNPPSLLVGEGRRDGATDLLELDFEAGADSPYAVTRILARSENVYSGALSPSTPLLVDSPSEAAAHAGIAQPNEWNWPTGGYAVGAGLFAFLVGLGYWFWPAIRNVLGLGFFSRLEKPRLLDHPVRQELVSIVENNPGIHFAEIARRLGAGNGNTEHHLRQLVAKNLLAEIETKGFRCYYVPGAIGAATARALPALKSRGARAVLRAIADRPGVNAQEVARAVGMSEPSVNYHLKRLKAVELIEITRNARSLVLRPKPAALAILDVVA